jgi:hypothetical protein
VSKRQKFYQRLISGEADADIDFHDLCRLLILLGFEERIRGDHHIFTKTGVEEIINIQPRGAQAKLYQDKQIRNLIRKYGLKIQEEK